MAEANNREAPGERGGMSTPAGGNRAEDVKMGLAMHAVCVREALPVFLSPMLCTSGLARSGPDVVVQLKWDGIRGQLRVANDGWSLRSRTGLEHTARFPELAAITHALRGRDALLDGELVVLDAEG